MTKQDNDKLQAAKYYLWLKYNKRCGYCGKHIHFTKDIVSSEIDIIERETMVYYDHINPLKKNGIIDVNNLMPSCWFCNSSKGARSIEYLRSRLMTKINKIPLFTDEQKKYLKGKYKIEIQNEFHFYFEELGYGDEIQRYK